MDTRYNGWVNEEMATDLDQPEDFLPMSPRMKLTIASVRRVGPTERLLQAVIQEYQLGPRAEAELRAVLAEGGAA